MKTIYIIVLLFIHLVLIATTGAREIRVPDDHATIQSAVEAAGNGDVIKVAQGTYKENVVFLQKDGVTLNGGYTPDFSVRDATTYLTSIDGGNAGSTVIFLSGESNTIDGFTITNGLAPQNGGGIWCYHTGLMISNNVITKNTAPDMGGGVYAEKSAPQIIDNTISFNEGGGIALKNAHSETVIQGNTITKNVSGHGGGGIAVRESNPHIIKNNITANQVNNTGGGGIVLYNASATIKENHIAGNKASFGGGIYSQNSEAIGQIPETFSIMTQNNIIENQVTSFGGGVVFFEAICLFMGNTVKDNSADEGGGLYFYGLAPVITNNVIAENRAQFGGGILCKQSTPIVANCIIAGNVAVKYSAAFHCDESSLFVKNCTFVRNRAKSFGNIFLQASSNLHVSNSIFWENEDDIILETTANPTIAYTHINDTRFSGVNGNIFYPDPMFADLDAGDYTLSTDSPCIDAGDPSSTENDPDGTRNDMGAFGGPGASGWSNIQALVPVTQTEDDAWNDLGLYGGQVSSIAIDPVGSQKMFAATYQGDGLFVSTDRGATWEPVPGFRNFANQQVIFDPNNSERVWAVYTSFIARSDDGGHTWSRWKLPESRLVSGVAVHPSNSQIVYVGTSGTYSSLENGTVFKTIDGGSTWQQTALAADKTVKQLVINPSVSDEIWVSTGYNESGSIYKSENDGTNWSKVDIGQEGERINHIVIDPEHPEILYLSGSFGILKSVDGGLNWDGAGVNLPIAALALDPDDPDIVYAASTSQQKPVFLTSLDAGGFWNEEPLEGIGSFLTLAISPDDSKRLFAGSYYGSGVYMSENGGQNWLESSQGITASVVWDSCVNTEEPSEILVGTQSGAYRRDSQNEWHRLSIVESSAVAQNPHNAKVIYSGQLNTLAKSIDGGTSWTETKIPDSQDGANNVSSIAVDSVNSQVLYLGIGSSAGNKGKVHKSVDGGQNLTQVLELTVPVNTVVVSPSDRSIIYAGSGCFYASAYPIEGAVYRSNDGGNRWSEALLSGPVVNAIQVDPGNADVVYAACGLGGSNLPGLFKSTDGGRNWQDKSFVDDAVVDIKIDPRNTEKIYAATHYNGIYLSIDGGENWINIGLTDYVTNDLSYHGIADAQTMHSSVASGASTEEGTSNVYAGTNSGVTAYTGSTIYGMIYKGDTTEVVYPADAWLDVGLDTPILALVWDTGHYLIAKPPVGHDYTLCCQADGLSGQISGIRVWSMADLKYDFHLQSGNQDVPDEPEPDGGGDGGGGGGGCFISTMNG
jgi:parallel beta-helix repeat protein